MATGGIEKNVQLAPCKRHKTNRKKCNCSEQYRYFHCRTPINGTIDDALFNNYI